MHAWKAVEDINIICHILEGGGRTGGGVGEGWAGGGSGGGGYCVRDKWSEGLTLMSNQ